MKSFQAHRSTQVTVSPPPKFHDHLPDASAQKRHRRQGRIERTVQ
jgi:hypothetical protein